MKPVPGVAGPVPEPGPVPPIRLPAVAERTLRNGLRVLAVRRPSVPRVELRLRLQAGPVHEAGRATASRVLPDAILGGTANRSAIDIARTLQRLGASLATRGTLDDAVLIGDCLAPELPAFLDLLAEIVAEPAFPSGEVAVARERVAQELEIMASQPALIARDRFARRFYGRHRYGRGRPDPDAVRRVSASSLRAYAAERLVPRGGTLVMVGDVRPSRALDAAERAFSSWRRPKPAPGPEPVRVDGRAVPVVLVDRPGSVQTSIRIGGPAAPRGHERHHALVLANAILGGMSISSRLSQNLRERRGYTYSPGSALEHLRAGSLFMAVADVGIPVTAAALVEMRYELARIASAGVDPDELRMAKRYLSGVLALQVQTQSGLADQLDGLTAAGLDVAFLRGYTRALERVSEHEVQEAAERYLSPKGMVTVLVGDASAVRTSLEALDDVEVAD